MAPRLVALGVALLALALPAHAGRSCEEKRPSATSVARGLELAEKTRAALEASGAQVVVLARAGQDLSRWGLRYSHLGLAYRVSLPDGTRTWRVLHKLNQCGTATSAIFRQGLGEFFLDDPWRYEAAWAVPRPDVQERLLAFVQVDAVATSLHHRPYSIVSYAWGTRYQQSNQWAIETLAAAMQRPGGGTRPAAQAWLGAQGYVPTTLKMGAFTRLGGRVTGANVAFDDHPPDKRFSDRIETVTVDSVFDWLRRSRLAGSTVTIRLEGGA